MSAAKFGRFAPSPTGDLHLGSLRTAVIAWLSARSSSRGFLVRIEDLDRERVLPGSADRQLADLRALGLDWDGFVVHQSTRLARYGEAITSLVDSGLTYECFCTRREVREAASAPQGQTVARYPGTCRELTPPQRRERAATRPPALRLRAQVDQLSVAELLHGTYVGPVEDIVLRRNDGLPAYNLAVVVDDADQGVDQVVRGDDLLAATPAQAHLADLLGLARPAYAHVPLALNGLGQRLAKRDGAVTMADLAARGVGPARVLERLARSLGFGDAQPREVGDLLAEFQLTDLPRAPWIVA